MNITIITYLENSELFNMDHSVCRSNSDHEVHHVHNIIDAGELVAAYKFVDYVRCSYEPEYEITILIDGREVLGIEEGSDSMYNSIMKIAEDKMNYSIPRRVLRLL